MHNLKFTQISKKIGIKIFSLALFFLLFSPLLFIISYIFFPSSEHFVHLMSVFLKVQSINTISLVIWVNLLVFLLVFPVACILSLFEFKGSKFLKFGLLLPIAIPSYIASYTYEKVFDYSGVINTLTRNIFGIEHFLNLDFFSFHGAVLVFTITLYPYLYMVLLSFFSKYIGEIIEVSRSLGNSVTVSCLKLILPLSKPAIVSGLLMLSMEIVNNFGVASYLGVETFSSSIFKAWFHLNDIKTAAKLASYLTPIVFLLITIFRYFTKTHITLSSSRRVQPIPIRGWKGFLASFYCGGLFIISFILPLGILCYYSVFAIREYPVWNILLITFNSIALSSISTLLLVILGIFFGAVSQKKSFALAEVFSLQYALPSLIIAVSVFITVMTIEKLSFIPTGLTISLQNSFLLLIFAYMVRFVILGYNTGHNAFKKIGQHYKEVAINLGYSRMQTFFRIELPLLIPNISLGAIIIFIDVFKELPLTLFLRPFNFDTPTTLIYDLVINEMFTEATPSALVLIIILSIITFIIFKIGYLHSNEGESE
ncbi:MAG: ABC transporter permease [Brevinema sp.]